MASGQTQVELQIYPVPEGWTGTINSELAVSMFGFIGFNDGSTGPEVDYNYGAGVSSKGSANFGGTFEIAIGENGGSGERVVGAFFGELNVAAPELGAATLLIEEGSFDVKHH